MRKIILGVAIIIVVAIWPAVGFARAGDAPGPAPLVYGKRMMSPDGKYKAHVPTNLVGSDARDHINRGSVEAIDISGSIGTPVFPIADGKVVYAGCNNDGNYGCWVYFEHAEVNSLVAHCAEGSILVASGDTVSREQPVCKVGMTGMTSWPHSHLEIHKKGGGRLAIESFFPRSQWHYCHFVDCRATNEPNMAVTQSVGYSQGSQEEQGSFAALPIWLAAPWILLFYGILVVVYGVVRRNSILGYGLYHATVFYAAVVTAALVLMPAGALSISMPAGVVRSEGTAPNITGGATWDIAYAEMTRSEGWKCTLDPVRTFGGVTQTTYNRYRREMLLPPAHVCESLTRAQAKDIYHRYYWVESGAAAVAKFSPKSAITYYDMAVNAGPGVSRQFYAECGTNVKCFNDKREAFYRSANLCYRYCAGWLNRLNRTRLITE